MKGLVSSASLRWLFKVFLACCVLNPISGFSCSFNCSPNQKVKAKYKDYGWAFPNEFTGFERPFFYSPNSIPNAYSEEFGKEKGRSTHNFIIRGNQKCKNFVASEQYDDCFQQSVRSYMTQQPEHNGDPTTQPQSATYEWEIFFPADFVYASEQPTGGFYNFVEWHNGQCPHVILRNSEEFDSQLYMETSVSLGTDYECGPLERRPILDIEKIKGRWVPMKAVIDWSSNENGKFTLFVDNNEVFSFSGPNLTEGFEDRNYFQFGIYLNNTTDATKVKETGLSIRNIQMNDN